MRGWRAHVDTKRRQKAESRSGENPDSGILDKGLGRRGLRLLGRNREIRRIPESESEVTARPLPQPLSIGWSGWPQAGKVTARQEPRPTGLGRLRLRHIGSPVRLFRCQFYHSIHSTTTHYIKLVQISHGEKFEERIDIMSHKGKIARLPLAIREQLNRRLQDGEIGRDLVVWLNSVPEVQAVLKAEFGERPVNEPNLSDWKTGGYQDWLMHQDTMAQVSLLVASAKALGGASPMPLTELLANCL